MHEYCIISYHLYFVPGNPYIVAPVEKHTPASEYYYCNYMSAAGVNLYITHFADTTAIRDVYNLLGSQISNTAIQKNTSREILYSREVDFFPVFYLKYLYISLSTVRAIISS